MPFAPFVGVNSYEQTCIIWMWFIVKGIYRNLYLVVQNLVGMYDRQDPKGNDYKPVHVYSRCD